MIASDILMSIGSTTASILKGPIKRSPTAIKLSKIENKVVNLILRLSRGGSYLRIYPSYLRARRGMPDIPSSHWGSTRSRGGLLVDPDKPGMMSSWSKLRHICPLEEFSRFLSKLSFPRPKLEKMFLWQQSSFWVVESTFWEHLQMVEVSSYSCSHIPDIWIEREG